MRGLDWSRQMYGVMGHLLFPWTGTTFWQVQATRVFAWIRLTAVATTGGMTDLVIQNTVACARGMVNINSQSLGTQGFTN